MMYIDDAIRGTIEMMEADASRINIRYGYNLAAIEFYARRDLQRNFGLLPIF